MVHRPQIDTKLCFVLMPFHKDFFGVYTEIIKPTATRVGLTADRADENNVGKSIIQNIWRSIWKARVVIVDVSTENPNVNYELGICHTIGVPTVIIARNKDDVPFDYQHLGNILYNPKQRGWKRRLSGKLAQAIKNVLKEENDSDLKWPYDTRVRAESLSEFGSNGFEDDFSTGLSSWVVPSLSRWRPKTTNRGIELVPHSGLQKLLLLERIPFFSDGEITCQVFLEKGALFNLIFRGCPLGNQFYMARLDTRSESNYFDCFVFKSGHWSTWWAPNQDTGNLKYHSPSRRWVSVRIVARDSSLSLYRDNQLVDQINDAVLPVGRIALFSEVANVYVRNVKIRPLWSVSSLVKRASVR